MNFRNMIIRYLLISAVALAGIFAMKERSSGYEAGDYEEADVPYALFADQDEAAYQADLHTHTDDSSYDEDGSYGKDAQDGEDGSSGGSHSLPEQDSTEGDAAVETKLFALSTEEKVAQLFVITPDALTGVYGVTGAGDATREAFYSWPVGGLVYFQENLVSRDQIEEMLENVQTISRHRLGVPVLTCVDEEGGSVCRISGRDISGVPYIASMESVGQGTAQDAYDTGKQVGTYLRELGFNVDFAPVADVVKDPAGSVIGSRSFGPDAQKDARMTAAFLKGLMSEGVAGTLKHFPGHGDTAGDSHTSAAVSYASLDSLRVCEFLPFTSGIEAGADLVMVGHISLPQVLGDSTPATVSSYVMRTLLRQELGFDGVIITDALNMAAISNLYSSSEAAVLSVEAGADMILMPVDFFSAYQGVLDAVSSGRISRERLDESVRRILKLKYRIDHAS